MSMKLEHITGVAPVKKTTPVKSSARKKYVSVTSSIYTLYVLEFINIIALIALWVKVFFYMKGE